MGILDSIGSFLGDEENRLNLASGFAGMTANPNAGNIQQGYQNRLTALRDRKADQNTSKLAGEQANRTANMLIAKGGKFAEVGKALLAKQITGAQAFEEFKRLSGEKPVDAYNVLRPSEVAAHGLDPTVNYQQNVNGGKISTIGGMGTGDTNIEVNTGAQESAGFANKKLFEDLGKGGAATVNALVAGYEPARASLNSIDTLQRLGDVMETSTSVPAFARSLVGEGWSSSIDAYNATARGVAQGLRVPGSGPMTDNDFKILLSRAGSASMNPDARMIIQSGLRAAAQRQMDLGSAANIFQLNASKESQKVYQATIEEIRNRPLFSEEERVFLEAFSPTVDSSGIDKSYNAYFTQLSPSKQARFNNMNPATQKAFNDAWLAGKVGK